MIEIRLHGRGGQGAIVASEILAEAFFREGKLVQTFPDFGVERRGAPVAAYLRVDDQPIRLRCRIYQPDYIVVLDPVLLMAINVTQGLKPGGWILINSNKSPKEFFEQLCKENRFKIATVDATKIALKYRLGSRTTPIVNTAILGGVSRLPGMVTLKSIERSIRAQIKKNTQQNIAAAREAYQIVRCNELEVEGS